MSPPLHIIVNPAAGAGNGPQFIKNHVAPLLDHLNVPFQIHTTEAPAHAGDLGLAILSAHQAAGTLEPIRVIVVGGDGTTHELIEGLQGSVNDEGKGSARWELLILPFGTANALYSSLYPPGSPLPDTTFLSSLSTPISEDVIKQILPLIAYLSPKKDAKPFPLPITLTTLNPPASASAPPAKAIPTHVVLSTSLHAAILDTSEKLRASHPGTARFKVAAQESADIFFNADATLFPVHAAGGVGNVEQWDPKTDSWITPYTLGEHKGAGSEWTVSGPFAYFLSTASVDRLEPAFVISPKTSLRPSPPASSSISATPAPTSLENQNQYIYLTILRPLRDPFVSSLSPPQRSATWSQRAFEVLAKAYHAGSHISLTYPASAAGEVGSEGWASEVKGEGEVVVELFRCGGFDWVPLSSQSGVVEDKRDEEEEGVDKDRARLVCADGALHWIPQGGKAEVRLSVPGSDSGRGGVFFIWA
ncbi:hypothetical protein I350_03202 [Cryptococcus amylolentus CBS 6273]|uniref:DAGKc domain-containing protein n=1 Tax=Cryptococcus amylolentus CBS 6273 TaxID=1296118 RepID=A0A1E3K9D8_9TREE|nr:hypothetical protein I350_03202 [Cryptococcus amylolentus CBS 6273]